MRIIYKGYQTFRYFSENPKNHQFSTCCSTSAIILFSSEDIDLLILFFKVSDSNSFRKWSKYKVNYFFFWISRLDMCSLIASSVSNNNATFFSSFLAYMISGSLMFVNKDLNPYYLSIGSESGWLLKRTERNFLVITCFPRIVKNSFQS